MSPDDALRLAARAEGLFPELTPQQVAFLSDQFAPYDAAVVDAELTRFRRLFETLHLSALLRRINDAQQKRIALGRHPVTDDRARADAQWKADDERLAKLSDDELARRKQAILDKNPTLKRFLGDKDPRTSVMLRSLILNS